VSGKIDIDGAFEAFHADDTMWYEISNLYDKDMSKVDKQYLFDKVQQLCNTKIMPINLLDALRWAINEQLDVPKDAIDKYCELVSRPECATESWLALEIAKLYHRETYPENFGEPFHNPEKVKKWISISFDLASAPLDYIAIIENVSQKGGGLHIGDKKWGRELLEQVKSKVDSKTFKKVERSSIIALSEDA
jgi:hypothetical protein